MSQMTLKWSQMISNGYVMFGTHPALKVIQFLESAPALSWATNLVFSRDVPSFRQAGYHLTTHKMNKITLSPHKDFMGVEDLGMEPPCWCKKFRGCHDCSFQGQRQTEAEALEYRELGDRVKNNPKTGRFEVEYAFIEDTSKLSNNLSQMIRIVESQEKKLA